MGISFTNLLNSVSDMGLVGCVGPQSFVAVQKKWQGSKFWCVWKRCFYELFTMILWSFTCDSSLFSVFPPHTVKENWICIMTRHHANNMLLARNLLFDSAIRQWSHPLMIPSYCLWKTFGEIFGQLHTEECKATKK